MSDVIGKRKLSINVKKCRQCFATLNAPTMCSLAPNDSERGGVVECNSHHQMSEYRPIKSIFTALPKTISKQKLDSGYGNVVRSLSSADFDQAALSQEPDDRW